MSDPRLSDAGLSSSLGTTGLGGVLRDARVERGLELADIAERTHVRQEYLRALEEGRYDALPEDVYARNFVRLFAQTVGVSPDEATELYQRERQRAGGLTTLEERLAQERRGEPPPVRKRRAAGRTFRVGPTALTLLLVAGLVGVAVWGYNSLFFRASSPQPSQTAGQSVEVPGAQGTPVQGEAGTTPAGSLSAPANTGSGALEGVSGATPASSGTVLITVITEPAGAHVSVDGFNLPGVTPISSAPVTARAGRLLRVSLEGHETWEETLDLTEGRTIEVSLAPATTSGGEGVAGAEAGATPVGSGQVGLRISSPSWLEVYRGTARNQGERLVYTTAQPGETYAFDKPVFVYVGNAAGVEVTLEGSPPFVMGSSGAIEGRAFE